MNLTATLVGQILVFGVLVWFIRQFLWDPILRVLEDRKKRIADGLAAAERGHHEKELADRRAKEVLKEARAQAASLLDQAHRRADEIVDESKENARAEGERLITAARAEIDQEIDRAKEQLRKEVAAIALKGASKILGREVNAKLHNDILTESMAEL